MTNQLFVFDLDGTLIDTNHLTSGRRMPWHIIEQVDRDPNALSFGNEIDSLPGRLIQKGYPCVILTRTWLAYTSTALFCRRIEATEVRCMMFDSDKESYLRQLATKYPVQLNEILYISNLLEDKAIADRASVNFMWATDLHKGALPEMSSQNPKSLQDQELSDTIIDLIPYLEQLGEVDRTAEACLLLTFDPGSPQRRLLQEELLRGLSPKTRDCVVEIKDGQFRMMPHLITLNEIDQDTTLRDNYLRAVRRMFPAQNLPLTVDGRQYPCEAVVQYNRNDKWGRVLKDAKDYGGPHLTRYRSRANVQLGLLSFVAHTLAAQLVDPPHHAIAFVPASPASEAQPGQVSDRLAKEVARLLDRPIAKLLEREGDEFIVRNEVRQGMRVVLIDDQLTHGSAVTSCVRALHARGVEVDRIITYSSNRLSPSQQSDCCGMASIFGSNSIECPCKREFKSPIMSEAEFKTGLVKMSIDSLGTNIIELIFTALSEQAYLTANELAIVTGCPKSDINSALYQNPEIFEKSDDSRPRWSLVIASETPN